MIRIVDASNVDRHLAETAIVREQIGAADLFALNKGECDADYE